MSTSIVFHFATAAHFAQGQLDSDHGPQQATAVDGTSNTLMIAECTDAGQGIDVSGATVGTHAGRLAELLHGDFSTFPTN